MIDKLTVLTANLSRPKVKGGDSNGANVIPLIFGPQYDITEDSAKTLEFTVIEQVNSNLLLKGVFVMRKKTKRIVKRWLALVLITALIGQTVSMRFFDTAYASGTEQIVSDSGTVLSAEQFTETDSSRPVTVLGEVESLRGENEKHFRMSDGSYMAVSYGMAVHVQDEDGEWQDIDNRMILSPDQTQYTTQNLYTNASFSASLALGGLFTTSYGDTSVSMSLMDTAQANQIMSEYAAELQTALKEIDGSLFISEGSSVVGGTYSQNAADLRPENGELSQTAIQTELNRKLELVGDTLTAGTSLLTFDRTALADTTVTVPTMVNTGSVSAENREGWTTADVLPDNLQSSVLYEDVFPGVDLLYTKYSHHVKEQIIVNAPQASYRYDFRLELDGVEAELNEDGSVFLTDADGEIIYYIPAPFMQDDNGIISYDVEYVLTPTEEGIILSVVADAEWMNDPERAYPVAIDPTLRMQAGTTKDDIYTGYIAQGLPNNAYGGALHCYVGYTSWNSVHEYRTFMYFNNLPNIPAGASVVDAKLALYLDTYSKVGCTELGLGIYPVDQAMPSTVTSYYNWVTFMTWNTQASYDLSNMIDYVKVSSGVVDQYHYWEITELMKKWYAEGTQNRTVALTMVPGGYSDSYYGEASFYAWGTTAPPMCFVAYRDQTGIEPYYTYRTMGAGHAGTAYIADTTGQVKVVKNILSYASTTNPFSLNLVYNSDYFQKCEFEDYQPPTKMGSGNVEMQLGQGWTLDIIQTMKTETIDGVEYICYHDGDGTKHYFRVDDAKNAADNENITYYYDEDGLGLKVKKTDSGFEMYDDHGNSWTFTSGRLTQTKDADGNLYTINYSNNKITSVVQTNNGQSSVIVATFDYSSSDKICITDAAENVYSLICGSGQLYSIILTDANQNSSEIASYIYCWNRLIDIIDKESAYGIHFGYDTVGRINLYQEKVGETTGTTVTVSYPHHSKTIYRLPGMDNAQGTLDDLYSHYLFDYAGRTVNAYTTDLSNNILGATNAVYTVDQTTTGTDKKNNRIEATGSIGVAGYNLLHNGGIENASGYTWTVGNGSRDTSKPRTGAHSLKGTLSSASAMFTATRGIDNLAAGATYTFSAYVNTSELSGVTGTGIYLEVADSAGNTFASSGQGNGKVNYVTSAGNDGGWVRIQMPFTTSTAGTHTLRICGTGAVGTFYVDDVQFEVGNAASSVNLLDNGNMETANYGWTLSSPFEAGEGWNGSSAIYVDGTPTTSSGLYQTVTVNLPGTQTYILSGWAMGNSVPDNADTESTDSASSQQKKFGLRAVITYVGSTTPEYHYVPFNADISDWQFASLTIVPKQPELTVSTIKVIPAYDTNANKAYFDNISLVREAAQSMRYDDDGNLESVTTTGLDEDVNVYDGGNLMQTMTGGNGTYTYTYDDADRVTSVANGVITQTIDYDTTGNVTSTTLKSSNSSDPLKIITSAAYTNNGNLIASVTDPLGNAVTYNYGEGNTPNKMYGLPATVTDPKGVITNLTYDAFGRTTEASIAGTAEVGYNYDSGKLSQIVRENNSSASQTYGLTYDSFGNMTRFSIGARTLASYTYGSGNGMLNSMSYGNGDSVSYTYDILGRVIRETHSDGRVVAYTYNSEGQLSTATDSVSGTTYYLYDSLGRLIYSDHAESGVRIKYTYDENNRLTRTDYSVEGWSSSYEGYTYNTSQADAVSDGALTSMRMTNNSYLNLGYNSLGRRFSRHIGYSVLERYYYKAGETSNSSSMVIASYEVDLMERSLYGFQYGYDENGNIERINELFSNTSVSYTYDNQNQLTGAVYSDGRTESYTYDTVGNLLNFNNGTTSHTYTYGNSEWRDLLTAVDGTMISYDTLGNPTSYYNGTSYAMSWIEGRKLSSVTIGSQTTSYLYNADGVRIRKNNSDGSYILYLVADGTIIGEKHYNSNGTATKHLRYIFDDNGTVCGYEKSTNGTSWWNYYFVRNIQGDVLHVYGSYEEMIVANYTYDSWGNILTSSGEMAEENPFRYRGYYYDEETGFYYLQSRYYDPEIGRFINADGFASTGQGMIGFNMFAYCLNNPVNLEDYSGMAARNSNVVIINDGARAEEKTFFEKVGEVYQEAKDYIYNDDEQKVLKAEKFAFYKGVPVVKVPFMDREAASFGIIFLGSNAGHRTDADQIVQHEYGHTVQMANMGVALYSITVAVPSVIGNRVDASGNMPFNYYSQPWEYGADIYGGVTGRAYDSWACWAYPIYAMATSTLRSVFPDWP